VAGGAAYSADNFLTVPPGASRDYSNLGAALAAYIVERVAGESFDAHTQRVIFAPLGMRTASWQWRRDAGIAHAQLYEQDSVATTRVAPYALASYPDGGLQMSVDDLATYFAMLLSHGRHGDVQVVDSAALAEMQRFQWTPNDKPADFALTDGNSGLFWRTKFGGRRIGHGGNDRGVVAEMLTDAAGRVGIVMIANTSLYGEANRHLLTILEALTAYGHSLANVPHSQGTP
jgi:CubicO group peptidase (beta-lactamase class C family)